MKMRLWLWLLLGLLVSATSWLYMHRVLLPWEHYVDVDGGRLKVAMGDLYPRWVGTRELLLRGRNPYSPEVSHEIQMAFYGRPIVQSYDQPASTIIDEQRFAYPLYVVFMLAPTVNIDFAVLQTWAPVVLALITAMSVMLWLEVLRWRPPRIMTAAVILFVLSSPQSAQGLRLRQLGLLVGCLLALGAWCVSRNHLVTAGIVFAASTIKPQMVILPVVWLLFWGIGDWGQRWRVLAGFFGGLGTLVLASELLLPGWLGYFFQAMLAYRHYVPLTSLLQVTLGKGLGELGCGIVVVVLLGFAWGNRKQAGNSPEFSLVLAACFFGTVLALPLLTPFNQVLLILPTLMVLRDWDSLPRLSRLAFTVIVGWPWVASLALLVFPPQLNSTNHLPLLPSSMVLVVPFVLALLLVTRRTNAY
jgi:hypothetical protein